jgi:uncharacterized protein (TIGR03086 family)
MPATFDLTPAADQVKKLLAGVSDEQLDGPTPCAEYTVRELLTHLGGLSFAFANAARKTGPTGPAPGTVELPADWRTTFSTRLTDLADAWRAEDAWQGMTAAGGIDLPGELCGKIALNELVLHGWDLAKATGQQFDATPESTRASLEFTTEAASPEWAAGRDGLFGEIVPVGPDAGPLERTLGLSGRDPNWRP